MSSKNQYKDYVIRLKKQVAELESREAQNSRIMNKAHSKISLLIFELAQSKKKLNSGWNKYKFIIGFIIGLITVTILIFIFQ